MGSIILNGVTIGEGSIVAAGALILERTNIPPGSLVVGHPGKDQAPADAASIKPASTNTRAATSAYKNIYREEPAG